MTPDFLTEKETTKNGLRVFRDEKIRTTWKVSFASGRFYRDTDDLYATQDIKFDAELPQETALEQLYEKATKYRNRVIKAGGWKVSNCYGGSSHIRL